MEVVYRPWGWKYSRPRSSKRRNGCRRVSTSRYNWICEVCSLDKRLRRLLLTEDYWDEDVIFLCWPVGVPLWHPDFSFMISISSEKWSHGYGSFNEESVAKYLWSLQRIQFVGWMPREIPLLSAGKWQRIVAVLKSCWTGCGHRNSWQFFLLGF